MIIWYIHDIFLFGNNGAVIKQRGKDYFHWTVVCDMHIHVYLHAHIHVYV